MARDASEVLHVQGFLPAQLLGHRLCHIKAMNSQSVALSRSARQRAREQAHDGAERIPLGAWREKRLIRHKPRPYRQPRIKRPPCDVGSGRDRLTQEVQ